MYILKTLTWVDTSYIPHPSAFSWIAVTQLFLGLLHDITEIPLLILKKASKEKHLFPLFCSDPWSGLVLFGGVFDLWVSEACLPEEHGADIVGNLFYS